jgi:hypothetical protein
MITARAADVSGPVTGDDWAGRLGRKHASREHAAAAAAQAARDSAAEMVGRCRERWARIVAAITNLAGAYNAGFDRHILYVTEDRAVPDRPSITIQAGGDGGPSLLAALEGTSISVRTSGEQGPSRETEHALHFGRSDDETAAYVVRDWMERL